MYSDYINTAKAKFKALPKPLQLIVLTVVILFLLIIFSKKTSQDIPATPPQKVRAIKIHKETHSPMLLLYGKVETPRRAKLRATIEANVNKTPFLEGTIIAAGKTAVQLDNIEAKLNVLEKNNRAISLNSLIEQQQVKYKTDKTKLESETKILKLLKNNVAREKNLLRRKLGSDAATEIAKQAFIKQQVTIDNIKLEIDKHPYQIKKLKADLEQARAQAALAELDLQRTSIKSPFLGKVAKLNVSVGSRVQPNQVVTEIYDIGNLELRVQIPTKYLNTVREGMQENVINYSKKLNAYKTYKNNKVKTPLKSENWKSYKPTPPKFLSILAQAKFAPLDIPLQLTRIAGEIRQGQGGTDAFFSVLKHQDKLPLGKILTLHLILPEIKNTVAIPIEALYSDNKIFIIEENKLKPMFVKRLGYSVTTDGTYQILVSSDELVEGSLLLTTQLPKAITGLKVDVATNE